MRNELPGSKRSTRLGTTVLLGAALVNTALPVTTLAQEPAAWTPELEFHTFSIVAIDPRTGESGVAVTTRRPCVGNAVPWVRAGIGAVATQGGTRIEYGNELLDLIEALSAGQALGGDGRHGQTQSAAVLVADPRDGMSRRLDRITVDINVCEHPRPVAEVRRIYETVSETLGYRTLRRFDGLDVVQLKLMLHALGYYRPNEPSFASERPDAALYDPETMAAVDRFRSDQNWQTRVAGLVDARTVERLWHRLEESGKATALRELTQVRR